jgi:hypothetical protein
MRQSFLLFLSVGAAMTAAAMAGPTGTPRSVGVPLMGMSTVTSIPGESPVGASPVGDIFSSVPGRALSDLEARVIRGGDVVMKLSPDRTKLTVDVYINDEELKRLNPKPIKTVVMDAHNRVVDTTQAPFMPAGNARDALPVGAGLTSRPARFPAGTWNVTEVVERSGSYGPNLVRTDAVGRVDVYAGASRVGSAADVGYAIHSNDKDFGRSQSYGCIVIRKDDNAALADILAKDRTSARTGGSRRYQVINVDD